MNEPPPGRRRLFGWGFWIMLAFAATCIVAGALVGFDGPRLFPPSHATPPKRPAGLAIGPRPGR